VRQFIYGTNIDEVLELEIVGAAKYYYHTNVQGNVVALTDDAGAVVEEYTYDIYGKAYRPLGTPITGTWTSVSYDGGTGLTTFTDTGLSLTAGEFKGGLVILNDSAGGNHQYKQFVIFDNGTDNIKILGDVDSIGLKPYSILARAYAVQGSGVGNVILFQGRRLDAESGLYYFRNRQYDPVHGRFLSRDPMGYLDSMNLYSFVNNNPVCYVDPSGRVIKYAATQVTWDFWDLYGWFFMGQTRNVAEIDQKDNCCLHYNGFTDYSTEEHCVKPGGWLHWIKFSFTSMARATVSTGACECCGEKVDGLEITVYHLARFDGSVSYTFGAGVSVGYDTKSFGKVSGHLNASVTIPPATGQIRSIYKFTVCPGIDTNSWPRIKWNTVSYWSSTDDVPEMHDRRHSGPGMLDTSGISDWLE